MEITLLGTGNPVPDVHRAGAATLVRAGGLTLLVDAGRGVLPRMLAAGALPLQLSAVLLTHLHSDHITDLNDVITTHWVMSREPTPLRIFGPPRTQEVVDATLAMLGPDMEYRLDHHADLTWRPQVEVTEVRDGVVLDEGGTTVVAAPTDHRPVEPTVGYRVEHDGKVAALAGDTVPCEGLDRLCRDADIYVQTVLREDLVMAVPMVRFQETVDYHSTVQQAGETAARNGVGRLVLTHMVPSPAPDSADEWVALAAGHFDGEVVFGEDLLTVTA
jgi:ribonuclease Z